jgi:hypothetical protein
MSSIFLSHNHKDKAFVRKLAERLNAHGIRTWVDEAEIRVGDSLIMKIESAIKDFAYLGVILSPSSVKSQWVRKEVNIALTQEIEGTQVKVLPLLIESCEIPGFLSDKLYADFTKDFEQGFETLLSRLNDDLHDQRHIGRRALELLQQFYQDWVSFGKPDRLLLKNEYVDVVLKYVPDREFSPELLEFLFSSIALSDIRFNEYISKIKLLLGRSQERLPDILRQLLSSPHPGTAKATIDMVAALNEARLVQMLGDIIDMGLIKKLDQNAIKAFVALVEREGLTFHSDLVAVILAKNNDYPDWSVVAYCIREFQVKSCLLIGDGTEFAHELGQLASEAGFQLITAPITSAFALDTIAENLLPLHKLIILVRGESFEQNRNQKFYKSLENYIREGGILFGTSFVGWETRDNLDFKKMLPFEATSRYNENSPIDCRMTAESPVRTSFATPVSFSATYEILRPSPDGVVWLEADEVPLFGYKSSGHGGCYYLNLCQHWCSGKMPSPFQRSNELSIYFQEVFRWIFETMKKENSHDIEQA